MSRPSDIKARVIPPGFEWVRGRNRESRLVLLFMRKISSVMQRKDLLSYQHRLLLLRQRHMVLDGLSVGPV